MKKIYRFFAVVVCITFASCSSTYKFCQIYETQPVDKNNIRNNDKGSLQYEDDQCIILYNFWSSQGSAGFEFYNKTDKIIYVDLTKSFFSRNGMAFNLYNGYEWSESSTTSTSFYSSRTYGSSSYVSASATSSVSATELVQPGIMRPMTIGGDVVSANRTVGVGVGAGVGENQTKTSGSSSSSSHTITITVKEQPIIAIPPHKSKYISTYSIATRRLFSCDLQRYPAQNSRMTFTIDNTPLQFANYITYTVGNDNNSHVVENAFYVSAVTNYAEPEIVEYKERTGPCENLKDNPNYASYTEEGEKLYDKYTKSNICEFASSFYFMYETSTRKRLYEKTNDGFYYEPQYDAYTYFGNRQSR